MDSVSAIDRARSEDVGPGQRFAAAAIEVCTRVLARANEVAVRWVPAHQGIPGNERADEHARAAAEGGEPREVPDEYRWGAGLSHMTRVATEARFRPAAQWFEDHAGPRRKYNPSKGKGLRRKLLRAPKPVASRYYQPLSGHAAIGPYLRDKIHKAVDDECWWCG